MQDEWCAKYGTKYIYDKTTYITEHRFQTFTLESLSILIFDITYIFTRLTTTNKMPTNKAQVYEMANKLKYTVI